MIVDDKYLDLLNRLIHDKRTGENGIIYDLRINHMIGGLFLSYEAMFDGHRYASIYVEDFEKGNMVFLLPYSVYKEEQYEQLAETHRKKIMNFFGDKFREDMIMKISENERQAQIRARETLYSSLFNWNENMRINKERGIQDMKKALVSDYGDKKQAVKEFAEKLLFEIKTVIKKNEADYERAEKLRDRYKIGFYTAQEENCLILENSINKLFTELYGDEK